MSRRSLLAIVGVLTAAFAAATAPPEGRVDFNRDVRPILADSCFTCHGPDPGQRKGKLRLDERASATADRKGSAAIVPGKPSASELIARITAANESERMPPAESGKKFLTEAQVATLKRWIEQGAEYQSHWAFIAPLRPALPDIRTAKSEIRNPIDRFVLARLERDGLALSPEGDPVTLVRRVTLDLTGLPPTPAEVDAYLGDQRADRYEHLVDRLLASPRYGERMALDWLDAARFADTHGYHIDSGRDMTRWRDWVINAFNTNKPYDQFTVEQIAGDLLANATIDQKIASGFNRNHMINFEGGAIPEEYLNAYIVDRVNTTATVWMGLTLGCCQCHDHKYDPFTQKEYYSFYAFFHNLPENGLDGRTGNAAPVVRVPSAEQHHQIESTQAAVRNLEAKLRGDLPEADAAQAEWERDPAPPKTDWRPVEVKSLKARGGASFVQQPDGSFLASGVNPETDLYTAIVRSDLSVASALRLEALPDEQLNAKGPGRSNNGNFVLTGVRVLLGEGRGAKAVTVKAVSADHIQKGFAVTSLLARNGAGWAILPETGKPHSVVFELAEPIRSSGQVLTLQLRFESKFAQHQIGRLRLSATDSATPHQAEGLPATVRAALELEPEDRTDAQSSELRTYFRAKAWPEGRKLVAEIDALRKRVAETEKQIPTAMVMQELPKPRDTFMLVRGQYDKKGDKVTAATPAALLPLPKDAPANRLGLARWLVDPAHPLTARVAVNRYWQMYFGTGLVKTAEDFGSQGEWPSHPELLDWLAVEFRDSGWNVKHLQRLILTSATYRQSAAVTPGLQAKDPENRLLARMTRLRLPAEFIRDQALAVSGLLNREIGGRSVSPYQPKGIWEELTYREDNANFTAQLYSQDHGPALYRRTMYTFWKRTAPPPSLITLDAPDREVCTVRRPRTNTPLQALVLMNDPTYVEAARKLAERTLAEGGATAEERIAFAFRLVTARAPKPEEVTILKRVLDRHLATYRNDPGAATKLLAIGEAPRDARYDAAEVAAWTLVATTILNLDEAVTRG